MEGMEVVRKIEVYGTEVHVCNVHTVVCVTMLHDVCMLNCL